MTIRLLEKDDWRIFREIRLEAIQKHPESFAVSYEEESILSDEAFKDIFNKSTFFGAFHQEKLVGCVGFFIRSHTKMRHKGEIFSMYTQTEHRGLGIGDASLKAVIAYAKSLVMQVHLMVLTTNHSALALYQKNGFRIYGTEQRSLKIGDQFYDEYLMVLDFL